MDNEVVAIIDKLQEFKNENAPRQVYYYSQELCRKLQGDVHGADDKLSSHKVAVILPAVINNAIDDKVIEKEVDKPEVEKITQEQETDNASVDEEVTLKEKEEQEIKAVEIESVAPLQENQVDLARTFKKEDNERKEDEKKEEAVSMKEPVAAATKEKQYTESSLWGEEDSKGNIAFSKNRNRRAADDSLNGAEQLSLNDRLRSDNEDLSSRLGNTPVKKLNQAIGINDKFSFVNELFREDQAFYNRSLKTIDKCKNIDEAMYWIKRELKIKLGWQDDDPTVQAFYKIVKKRFS